MQSVLSINELLAVENSLRGRNCFEVSDFPTGDGKIYISKQFEMGASELLHYHDEPHLTMIIKGGILDKRKNLEKGRFSGELMFFSAEEIHQTTNKIFPITYLTATFSWDFLHQQSLTEARMNRLIKQNPHSKFNLLKIYKELLANDEFSASTIEMLLLNLVEEKKHIKNLFPKWIDKVYQLLNDNWNKEISLADLATAAEVHPKTISRHFPKYFACTLGEYRRQLKVEKSLKFIKNSKLSLTEIAHECNFADQSHFIRTFKNLTGFLPKEFQRL